MLDTILPAINNDQIIPSITAILIGDSLGLADRLVTSFDIVRRDAECENDFSPATLINNEKTHQSTYGTYADPGLPSMTCAM